jgi:hypothetical protein
MGGQFSFDSGKGYSLLDVISLRDSVRTRYDLARFVYALREDLQQNEEEWENPTLERFLEAMGAWISSLEGWFYNRGESEPDQPDWLLVAHMLFAASVYE